MAIGAHFTIAYIYQSTRFISSHKAIFIFVISVHIINIINTSTYVLHESTCSLAGYIYYISLFQE